MDKSSSLLTDDDPLIECGIWHHASGDHYNAVWLDMRLNPAGMRLIQEVDINVEFMEGFGHTAEAMGAMHNAGVTPLDLKHPEGLEKLHRWMVKETSELYGPHVHLFPNRLLDLIGQGYPYSVKCDKGSPLLDWFIVLGGKQYGR